MSVLHAADLYKLQVRAGAMQPRRRRLASYPLLAAVGLASVVVLYQMRHVARQQLELERAGGAGRDLPAGREGAGEPAGEQQRRAPAQEQRLAVLLPCWADCPQASILVVYLSGLLRQQGIPFRIFVLQQAGEAAFNPGLLVNLGLRAALELEEGFSPDYIAYQQAGLVPHTNTSYAYPSMPFLHLATEQSMFNNVLPYDAYCGGAWLARVGFFQQLGGMPAAYVGYEGAEDEFCRRVAVVGGGGIPRAQPGRGRFTVIEDAALQQLAAGSREQNMRLFKSRWGENSTAASQQQVLQEDGLATIPPNWPQLLAAVERSDVHSWWRLQLPGG